MITAIFVEGNTDLYFFQTVLTLIKDARIIEHYQCIDARDIYFRYRRPDKMVIKSGNDYAVVVSCDGKQNAIETFIASIGDFLKSNNPVGKVCLIVDQDMDQGLECRLTDRLKSLTTSFSNEQVTLTAFKTHDSLHKSCISRKSKKIQLGFTEVKPSLESIISRFLRSYCRIPQDQISGNEHETIRMACTYLNLDGKQNLFAHFANDYPSQLKTEMTRTELKQTVCFLL